MTPRKPPANEPEIVHLPSQKMAAIYAKGRPDRVLPRVLPTLINSVYALKFESSLTSAPSFSIGKIRVRFPDAHLLPIDEWTNVIGLPVPESTRSLPQQIGGTGIKLETWEYGTVAQINALGNTVKGKTPAERLHRFIIESGHVIIGVHEEEYVTGEDSHLTSTIIRYRVKAR